MKKTNPAQKTEFRSIHGTVIVYTRRHINGCTLRNPNNNSCSCPKWLYAKPRGGKAVQRSLATPSFTEACEHATKVLAGFNPEIAAARKVNEPKLGITIENAISAYEASLKRRGLSMKYLDNCVQPFKRRSAKEYGNKGRAKNLSLLDFLARANLGAREPVTRVEQLNSDHLDAWAATWKTNDASSHLWRGVVAKFMRWARTHDHIVREPEFREPQRVAAGNRCGFFSNEQYAKLRAALPFWGARFPAADNAAARLGAFMDAGRWGGMAIVDIVFLSPRLNIGPNNVLTYRRRKSGVVASVLLAPDVAARLRAIPPEPGSDVDRPFRFEGSVAVNCQRWRARFEALCALAGVTEIETENGRKVGPHPHALRDSCAIDALLRGVSLENVAKLLGHSNTQMTQKSYVFWIKQRVDHCIEDQRQALRHVQAEPQAESRPPDEPPTVVQ